MSDYKNRANPDMAFITGLVAGVFSTVAVLAVISGLFKLFGV